MSVPAPGRLGKPQDTYLPVPVPVLAGFFAAVLLVGQIVFARFLGTMELQGCFCGQRERLWSPAITLTLWFSAIAVFGGFVLARQVAKRQGKPSRQTYVKLLAPTGVGVIVMFPLVVALGAGAKLENGKLAGLQLGLVLPMGLLLGVLITVVATSYPILARAAWLAVAWVWLLGLLSVVLSWGDRVGQTVPLGSVYIGGPGRGAPVLELTGHDIVTALADGVAVLGPALISIWLTYRVLKVERPLWQAVASGVLGPCMIVLSYLLRADVITGENSAGFSLALKALVLTVITSVITVFVFSLKQQPKRPVIKPHPLRQYPCPSQEQDNSAATPLEETETAPAPMVIEGVLKHSDGPKRSN